MNLHETVEYISNTWPVWTAFGGFISFLTRFIIKSFRKSLTKMIEDELKPIGKELKNNGGSSIKDAIDGMNSKIDRLDANIERVGVRLVAMREGLKSPYIEMDENLQHTFANQAFVDLFGGSYQEINEKGGWQNFMHPDDLLLMQNMAQMLKETPTEYVLPSRIINKKRGKMIHILSKGYPMVKDGELLGYAATVITEREEDLPEEFK